MRALAGLWRWSGNPVRRGTDLAESWVALCAAVLIGLGAPAAGVTAGTMAGEGLAEAVREQRQERHLVQASLVRELPRPPVGLAPETPAGSDAHRRAVGTWTAVDGTEHTGPVNAPAEARPGDRFGVWTDSRGRPAARPMDATAVATHAVLAGAGALAGAVGLVEGARRLAVHWMLRRRYAKWDRAWERAGQDWGKTGTGS